MVLLGHVVPDIVPGGFVGVDVFFVISGYLIGRSVILESREGRFSFLNFYRRRARRILPALMLVIALSLGLGIFVLDPWQFSALGRAAAAAALLVANVHDYHSVAYFTAAAMTKPLLHLWSIGIEEQFYLLFPLGVVIGQRLASRHLRSMIFIALATSLVISECWLLKDNSQAAYFLLPSRLFELLTGTAVALLPAARGLPLKMGSWAGLTGVGLVIAAAALFGSETLFPGLAALIPCLGAALVIWADNDEGLARRFLATPPLVFMGTISYSLYLWHWPLLAFGRLTMGPEFDGAAALLLVIVSILIATLSYRWIEKPFLVQQDDSRAKDNWRSLVCAGLTAGFIFGAGQIIVRFDGFPARYSPDALALAEARGDYNPRRGACHNGLGRPRTYGENCRFGDPSAAPDLAVWGDSRGAEISVALGEQAKSKTRSIMQITASGCPPALGYREADHPHCEGWIATTLAALTADERITTVVLAAAGASYDDQESLKTGYERTVQALVAAGKAVVLISENPIYHFDPPAFLALTQNFGGDPTKTQAPATRLQTGKSGRWRQFLEALAGASGASLVDPSDAFCSQEHCRLYDRTAGVLYFDSFHLSVAGAKLAMAPLSDAIYGGKPR